MTTYTHRGNAREAAQALADRTGETVFIITLGQRFELVFSPPGIPVQPRTRHAQ